MKGLAQDAVELLGQCAWGLLSTHSARHPGFPFGSVVGFVLDKRSGAPLMLMSGLAEHAKNIAQDGRCSLLVLQSGNTQDLQEAGRLTLLGRLTVLPESQVDGAQRVYLGAHPEAKPLLAMTDFRFYSLAIEHARFIAGFGQMGWLTGDQLRG